jgi:hypothetical protein
LIQYPDTPNAKSPALSCRAFLYNRSVLLTSSRQQLGLLEQLVQRQQLVRQEQRKQLVQHQQLVQQGQLVQRQQQEQQLELQQPFHHKRSKQEPTEQQRERSFSFLISLGVS